MAYSIDDVIDEWRKADGPLIVQASTLRMVAAEFDTMKDVEYELASPQSETVE